MNGIPALAQAVQSRGRGKDTQLVHMTPNEVRGLQAIAMAHGGSLTTNPDTGLPEAGFLDNILPVIAGAGLNMMFPGLGAAMGGFAIPGIVAGGTALATKDINKGLMAGLGAYGGAKLGSALDLTGRASVPGMSYDPNFTGDTGLLDRLTGGSTPSLSSMRGPASFAPGGDGGSLLSKAGDFVMSPITALGEGISSLTNSVGRGEFMNAIGGVPGLLKVGVPLAGAVMGGSSLFGGDDGGDTPRSSVQQYIRPYEYTAGRTDVPYRTGAMGESTGEQEYFRPTYTPMPIYAAKNGGSVPELEEGGFVMTKKAVDGMGGGDNKKGQEALAKGLGAIPIKGKGTGTSDSIKTTIAGKTPARVSNGEAYVSKNNVKKAGGTTNMYALMRKAERRA